MDSSIADKEGRPTGSVLSDGTTGIGERTQWEKSVKLRTAPRPTAVLPRGRGPALFVVLWSTGFIGAKLGLPYAGPFTFLALRFVLAAALLVAAALATRAPWPRATGEHGHYAVAGLLVHGALSRRRVTSASRSASRPASRR